MTLNKPYISVIIPVYMAENCLNELYRRLRESLETISSNFEIILVEDNGNDNSWLVIEQLASIDSRVLGLQFSRNFGQHYGITAGLDHCRGDWIIVMDCDLQDRPEEIPFLYAKIREGYKVVLAKRGRRSDPIYKRLMSYMYYGIFNYFTGMKYDGNTGNFRIMSYDVVQNFCTMRERLRFFGGMICWMGYPTTSINVQHDERYAGKSAYTFRKLWKLAYETIIAYSDKPLRLTIKFGFFISFFSFLYGSYIVYRGFTQNIPIMGWSSLIVSIYFLGGIVICILGILGLYLGNIFEEVKKRPLYIINRTTRD
jgi:glycosyltransferase involved in cell wall biosynthesis